MADEGRAEQEGAAREAAAARRGVDEAQQVVGVGGGEVDRQAEDQKVAQQDEDGQRLQVEAAHHDAAHQDGDVDLQGDHHQDDD